MEIYSRLQISLILILSFEVDHNKLILQKLPVRGYKPNPRRKAGAGWSRAVAINHGGPNGI